MNTKFLGTELFHAAPDTGTGASAPSSEPGTRADNPVSISKTCVLTEDSWNDILDEIEKKDLFTALDISACTKSEYKPGGGLHSDGTINPQSGSVKAKEKIVSLVLPNEAVKITDAVEQTVTVKNYFEFSVWFEAFKNFKNLKSVSGVNITCIGLRAFKDCFDLSTVDFPNITNIGVSAFLNCAFAEANFPEVIGVENSAFENCDALTSVNLPKCLRIGNNAFKDCGALVEVNLPSIISFGKAVFSDIKSKALTIRLGDSAPYLWGKLFEGISESITVTVKIPRGAAGYGVTWQNSLKAGDDNIKVVIEELP